MWVLTKGRNMWRFLKWRFSLVAWHSKMGVLKGKYEAAIDMGAKFPDYQETMGLLCEELEDKIYAHGLKKPTFASQEGKQ
jgi:hypothetical protein